MSVFELVLLAYIRTLDYAIEVQKDMTPERAEKFWARHDKWMDFLFGWIEKLKPDKGEADEVLRVAARLEYRSGVIHTSAIRPRRRRKTPR
jgi:hypothetical protein